MEIKAERQKNSELLRLRNSSDKTYKVSTLFNKIYDKRALKMMIPFEERLIIPETVNK